MRRRKILTIICIVLIEISFYSFSNATIIDSDNGKMKFYKIDENSIFRRRERREKY